MTTPVRLALAPVALLLTAAVAYAVYRDAVRIGLRRPFRWVALVTATTGAGLFTIVLVPTVPVPGALVLVLAGPVLYLFERDDTEHGDEPADPHVLPGASPDDRTPRSDEESDLEATADDPAPDREADSDDP
ncbi:hypothetical protein ACFQGT_15400 [Natrialbaceae archaeon GCM10025810]|uniref:hypothetical protein n=1 Tax=Halovalidus salilacus TaxID=3075124 RepID=UPI00361ADE0C